jgi:hypothetical protein
MACCGHWHGPSCWHAGYPFYGYPEYPPPPPPGRRGRPPWEGEEDLEEELRRLEAEMARIRHRLEELHAAQT